MRHLPALIATMLMVSCDRAPDKSPSQLKDEIHAAAKAAEESVLKCDGPAAEAAASKATVTLDQLRKIQAQAGQPGAAPVDAALLAECEAEARRVGHWAALTKEKVACSQSLRGWKAKTYDTVRSATFKVMFHGLALAADQGAAGNLKHLPQSAQDGAKEAARFIESYIGPQRTAAGDLDWAAVSRELKKFAEAPPLDMRHFMVLMLLLGMDFDSAFYEVEAIPMTLCKTSEEQVRHHLLRGASLMAQSHGLLALAEFEAADKLSTEVKLNLDPAAKCGLHLALTFYFLHERRWADADRCLAAANRAWPDNPVVVYLTGERQIATNNYAAADASFAKALKGTDYEWLAEKVAARVKRLRDSPASLEPVLFDFDLMADLGWAFVKDQTTKSEVLKKFQTQMDSTKAFIQELKQKMPDVEMKMPDVKGLFKKYTEPADSPK